MNPAQGAIVTPLWTHCWRYRSRALRLLLVLASLLASVRLGSWVKAGVATLIIQTNLGNNTFTTLSLVAPSSLAASTVGGDVHLSWAAGQNGASYALSRAANGNNSDCSGASFSSLAAVTANQYLDQGRDSPPGSWDCYRVATAAATWTSHGPNPTAAVQLGFVAQSVVFINAGNTTGCGAEQTGVAGDLDCGDQIVIHFNQPVMTDTGPSAGDTVCADSDGDTLRLGSPVTTGACSPAEAVTLGMLSGSAVDGCDCRFVGNYTWGSLGQTLTITLGARTDGAGYPSLGGALWTFQPTTDTARLLSATGAFHVCDYNSGATNCWPATHN